MPFHRRKTITVTIGCLLFVLICLLVWYGISARRLSLDAVPLTEGNQILSTPYCGFYHLYGYTLSEQDTSDASEWCQNMLATDSQSIVLLQINLRHYANKPVSPNALEQLDTIFSAFSGAGKQIILRFVYDWDGNALQTEPSSRKQIEAHMTQTAPTVNRYSSHIFLMQGVFTGNCGEMNQTHYGTNDDIICLMTTLSNVISPDIFLSVRTPQHLRTIVGTGAPLAAEQAYNGTLISRLGLYNDGMFGNDFDCGTYDDTPRAGSSDYTEKGTRDEELDFQNKLCRYVPNGGEAVLDNPYNDLDAAITDLSRMHVSYLSCDHDASVINKWKSTTFDSMNGYDYIAAHLGYRFVVRKLDSSPSHIKPGIILTLKNTGFSPSYRNFNTSLILHNEDSGDDISLPVAFDTRTLLPDSTCELTVPVDSVPNGSYSVTLCMTDPATGLAVPFANTGADSDGQLLCGQLTLSQRYIPDIHLTKSLPSSTRSSLVSTCRFANTITR